MNNENIKTRVWQTGLVVGILLAVFLAVVSLKEIKSISYVGRDVANSNIITVNGKGETVAVPNIATFSFGVTETAKTVTEAQNRASTKINNAIKALKDSNVAEKDIKTTGYNINPHYDYQQAACVNGYCPGGKQILTGYDVSQNVEVKIRKLDQAGDIFAKIGSLDVQNVNGLNFSIDDIDNVKAEARRIAINNAQEKAKELAAQLGVHIVRITSFYDQSDEPIYYGKGGVAMDSVAMAPRAQAIAPQLPTGEQKITANVNITYEIR